ncbi:MAG: hypothetical protein R3F37_05980 [Candidatus Competibacteraceae bacterium]
MRQKWAETIRPMVEKVRKNPEQGWQEIRDTCDWLSLRQFLELHGWSSEAIELYGLLENTGSEMDTSIWKSCARKWTMCSVIPTNQEERIN